MILRCHRCHTLLRHVWSGEWFAWLVEPCATCLAEKLRNDEDSHDWIDQQE